MQATIHLPTCTVHGLHCSWDMNSVKGVGKKKKKKQKCQTLNATSYPNGALECLQSGEPMAE